MSADQLILTSNNLPERFEDVASFAVLAQEKLKSVRAEISAIKRLGLAQEVLKQKIEEAQELGEVKIRAEARLGELTRMMPKKPGARTDITSSPEVTRLETKTDALKRVNIPKQRASQYEALAANPELVEQAIAEARENDDIVSRSQVLDKVQAKRREEERRERAKADERIEASRQSTQAFLDTVKRQHGIESDNTVDLNTYQVAKREADYYRKIADDRMIKALWHALSEVKKLPEDEASYESMWRGSIDPMSDVQALQQAIERLTRVVNIFIKKGDKDIDEVFKEVLEGDKGAD